MSVKHLTCAVAMLGLAACASTPQERFANSVSAAKQAGQPLVIYDFYVNHPYLGPTDTNKTSPFARIGFISTANQQIDRVVFEVEAYRRSRPVWDESGKPFVTVLTAMGPIAPDADQDMVTKHPLWMTDREIGCAKLTGIHVDYHDGTSVDVPEGDMAKYVTPQININCAHS